MLHAIYPWLAIWGQSRAYLRWGFRGFKPPPPKFSDFFLKSEGKEIERKRDVRGEGGYLLTYFWG